MNRLLTLAVASACFTRADTRRLSGRKSAAHRERHAGLAGAGAAARQSPRARARRTHRRRQRQGRSPRRPARAASMAPASSSRPDSPTRTCTCPTPSGSLRRTIPSLADLEKDFLQQQPRSYLYFGVTQVLDTANRPERVAEFAAQPQHPDIYRCGVAPVVDGYPLVFIDKAIRHKIFNDWIYEPANASAHPLPAGANRGGAHARSRRGAHRRERRALREDRAGGRIRRAARTGPS